ncbi:flagellar brake domain-containing protein [Bacillus sp. FJAT-47783]|uniref:flagellar brake protein n=1 Tax=Bacillus sp. FJAT-47783 TaxID=2922712 RepID=UPI001FAB7697|nr:flagellar brake domain-containing protein [Bacillus sp. FJAT-47783]
MLSIGSVMTLEVLSSKKQLLRCKLLDREEDRLLINFPINEDTGRTAFLHIGTELLATFITENNQVFRFKTFVIGKKKENIPMIILKEPKEHEVKHIQRRQFVRIDTRNDVAVHSINNEFEGFTTITDNISGGGVAIFIPEQADLIQGIDVKLWLVLPFQDGSIEYLQVLAHVVRIDERDHQQRIASLQFLELDKKSQQKIMRFCFETQLQQKKQGIIE